ncbi:MAG TPA: GNAT family N-acetyltransferase [Fervidobacterium sp.]|nr:GNAT family N-acetyltransferase [Fervidobacterium sp.]
MLDKLNRKRKLWGRSRYILTGRSTMRRIGLKYVKMIEFERLLNFQIPEVMTKLPVKVELFSTENANSKVFSGVSLTAGEDPLSHDKTLKRVATGGELCLVAFVENRVTGYVWVLLDGTNYEPDLEMEEKFEQYEGLIYQLHVFPMFRNLGVATKLNKEGLQQLKDKADNIPSIRSFKKVGFYPTRSLSCLRVFMFKSTKEHIIDGNSIEGDERC